MSEELARAIYHTKFHYKDEKELQHGIGLLLTSLGLEWKAEVELNKHDRIDFIVGDVGIECKVDGSLASVTRQIFRYSQVPEIKELILVTSCSRHQAVPSEMNGKPVYIVYLLSSFL